MTREGCVTYRGRGDNMEIGSFPFVPPPPVRYAPPVTEHVPLLISKSLCKNKARASGGANNIRPLSWGGGGTNGKDLGKDPNPVSFATKLNQYFVQPKMEDEGWETIVRPFLTKLSLLETYSISFNVSNFPSYNHQITLTILASL